MSLTGKVALVTGGASGMGRICALRFASQGASVAIVDLNEEGLNGTASESERIHSYRCDVSSQDQVQQVVARIAAELGPVDRLVHAAALMPSHALCDHDADGVMRLMQINYAGTVYMVKAVLPSMLERDDGQIIVFGSVAGDALVPKMGAYGASKAAVNVYAETLHYELAKTGISVHLVCPPAVNTPLVEQSMATDAPGSMVEARKSGRLADPDKIVDAIERGVARGKAVIFPGEARLLYLWHALLPRLWWRVVLHYEK